jgi:FlaA1/EpsC-like NDP-sugar epimerase
MEGNKSSAFFEKSARFLRHFVGGQGLLDFFTWPVAILLAAIIRFEFNLSRLNVPSLVVLGFAIAMLNFPAGKLTGLYRSRHRVASLDQLLSLAGTAGAVGAVAFLANFSWGPIWGVPRTTTLIATGIFVLISGAVRVARRTNFARSKSNSDARRILIYGAGQLAETLIRQIQSDSEKHFLPVGLLDDDPGKSNRWISGVKMKGNGSRLEGAIRETKAEAVVVAISRADHHLFERIHRVVSGTGVDVLVLPNYSQILSQQPARLEFRNLKIDDLIGRRSIDIDLRGIRGFLEGKSVLVTGAGGSIGVELCRQVSLYKPSRLVFLDRDETGLQHAQLATSKSGLLVSSDYVLADIRDHSAVQDAFEAIQPDVVFHAAALKHLPVLEQFPLEGWKTNVIGTLNVLRASQSVGVKRFINISTDKASNPSSVLGATKLTAERITSWFDKNSSGTFLSVRFGNVLGSRGSLIPTLTSLIEDGGPISVTHPEVTRYFMTIPEASQLVLQSAAFGRGGSVFVLDMGTPVKILDIAHKMIAWSGKHIDIIFTGLRPGEKLHEQLFSEAEGLEKSSHELIFEVKSEPLDPDFLKVPEDFRRKGRRSL